MCPPPATGSLRRGGGPSQPKSRSAVLCRALLKPTTRRSRPRTGTPGQLAGRVGSRGPGAGGRGCPAAAWPTRDWPAPQRAALGLVVLCSARGRCEPGSAALRGDGDYISQKAGEARSPGKRRGRRRFPGAMGPVLAVGGCREARAWSLQGGPRPMGPGRAGPMLSSVAAPDCCGGLGNLDFRKVPTAPAAGPGGGSLGRLGPRRAVPPPTPGGGVAVTRQRGRGGTAGACV